MTAETVKHIPYGVSDYARIVQRHYYYVDKTPYLVAMENAGDYLFLIRPRRFGKSLFVAVMESYYDVLYKDRFEELFKRTWIYHWLPSRGKVAAFKKDLMPGRSFFPGGTVFVLNFEF